MITKQDIDKLLAKFQEDSWIDESEANEIREYLHSQIDDGTLEAIDLEAAIDIEWQICSPATLWETLEEIWSNN